MVADCDIVMLSHSRRAHATTREHENIPRQRDTIFTLHSRTGATVRRVGVLLLSRQCQYT